MEQTRTHEVKPREEVNKESSTSVNSSKTQATNKSDCRQFLSNMSPSTLLQIESHAQMQNKNSTLHNMRKCVMKAVKMQ